VVEGAARLQGCKISGYAPRPNHATRRAATFAQCFSCCIPRRRERQDDLRSPHCLVKEDSWLWVQSSRHCGMILRYVAVSQWCKQCEWPQSYHLSPAGTCVGRDRSKSGGRHQAAGSCVQAIVQGLECPDCEIDRDWLRDFQATRRLLLAKYELHPSKRDSAVLVVAKVGAKSCDAVFRREWTKRLANS